VKLAHELSSEISEYCSTTYPDAAWENLAGWVKRYPFDPVFQKSLASMLHQTVRRRLYGRLVDLLELARGLGKVSFESFDLQLHLLCAHIQSPGIDDFEDAIRSQLHFVEMHGRDDPVRSSNTLLQIEAMDQAIHGRIRSPRLRHNGVSQILFRRTCISILLALHWQGQSELRIEALATELANGKDEIFDALCLICDELHARNLLTNKPLRSRSPSRPLLDREANRPRTRIPRSRSLSPGLRDSGGDFGLFDVLRSLKRSRPEDSRKSLSKRKGSDTAYPDYWDESRYFPVDL
jgi:hypothetical protein